jgi:hypothetical protein
LGYSESWSPHGLFGALGPDCLILKYAADGSPSFTVRDPAAGNGRALVLDGTDHLYATGLTGMSI